MKKFILLAMAIGAFTALAGPAFAQADEVFQEGVPVELEKDVTATSTNLVTSSVLGNLECTRVTIHGILVENGPGIALEETATTTEGCNVPITQAESGDIALNGGAGSSTASHFQAAGLCNFDGNIPFSYTAPTSELTVEGKNQLNGNCGPATMTGSFSLETPDGTPLVIE